jgi:uncharacterized protein (TIGR02594 family)
MSEEPAPAWLSTMQGLIGVKWAPGDPPNQNILSWLDFIGNKFPGMSNYCAAEKNMKYFSWCGLTVGYCMAMSGIQPIFGDKDIDRFLWALAWLEWGESISEPKVGDVLIFDFGAGDQHVTLFAGMSKQRGYYSCLGGNQGHQVKLVNFPKKNLKGIRRPANQ